MPTILVVGHDQTLLLTRTEILRKIPAEVFPSDAEKAMRLLKEKPVDMVVLCHTMRPEEIADVAQAAHKASTEICVLQIVPMNPGNMKTVAGVDELVSPSPGALRAMVTTLLNRIDTPSNG